MDTFIPQDERAYLQSILSEEEQLLLGQLADNSALLEAIKKVILAPTYLNGTQQVGLPSDPLRNFLLSVANRRDVSNDILGQLTRSAADACVLVETGFNMLKSFVTPKEKVDSSANSAR